MDARKILGIGPDATAEEIHRAYREKARKHHPDLGGDAWAFQQVQEAYEQLTNPQAAANKPVKPPSQAGTQTTRSSRSQGQSEPQRDSKRTRSRSAPRKKKQPRDQDFENRKWTDFFAGELPLQNETTYFILVNCLDIFVTWRLMVSGAVEANPVANHFFKMWGFNGMIVFKLIIVAIVCMIAQVVAFRRIQSARFLLIVGTVITGCVVVYSLWLFRTHFG